MLNGWRMWICGKVVVSNNVADNINFARKTVERELTTKWKPILKLMEQCPGWEVQTQVEEIFVQSSFIASLEFLKTKDGNVWRRAKDAGILS